MAVYTVGVGIRMEKKVRIAVIVVAILCLFNMLVVSKVFALPAKIKPTCIEEQTQPYIGTWKITDTQDPTKDRMGHLLPITTSTCLIWSKG